MMTATAKPYHLPMSWLLVKPMSPVVVRPVGGGGTPVFLGWPLDATKGATTQQASTQPSTTSRPTSQRSPDG